MLRTCIGIGLVAAVTAGCGSVNVIKNPGPDQGGIRYYRPKPYLLVTPADPTGRMVKIETKYLPDFSEEYALKIRGKAAAKLKDGWNLVEISTGKKQPPPPAPAEPEAPAEAPAGAEVPPMVVAATNVPIGYYESVYGEVGGRKFLKGWQYVGFSVLGGIAPPVPAMATGGGGNGKGLSCPHGRNGGVPCRPDGNGVPSCMANTAYAVEPPLYGLVMINGVMTFRMIDEIAANQVCPFYVATPSAQPAAEAVGGGGVETITPSTNGGGVGTGPVEGSPAMPVPNPAGGEFETPPPADGAELFPPQADAGPPAAEPLDDIPAPVMPTSFRY